MEDLNEGRKKATPEDGSTMPPVSEPIDPKAMLEALGKNEMYIHKPEDGDERPGRRHTEDSEN